MHTLPYAAWLTLVSLVASVVPEAPGPDEACAPPACVGIAHALLFSPPVSVAAEGAVVEWRAGSGPHWLVEAGTPGGCLAFALKDETLSYRVSFVAEEGSLYALHHPRGDDPVALACNGAVELPNGAFLLRYACQLHAREGGVGLLLVAPARAAEPADAAA